jgi:response regulator RpfG family c-di-GMP phosphodiesterase
VLFRSKIGVPDRVLCKPGPLNPEEWEMVRRHPVIGAEIVRPVKALAGPGGLVEMILHHHERFDGAGYPAGLAGADIPLGARIIAVADSLSAMMQVRPYKGPRTFAAAALEIKQLRGRNYDPVVVEAFLDNLDSVAEQLALSRLESMATPGQRPSCDGRCPHCRL